MCVFYSPTEPAEFCLGIVHDYGPLWDIRWCPSGAWDKSSTQVSFDLFCCGIIDDFTIRYVLFAGTTEYFNHHSDLGGIQPPL